MEKHVFLFSNRGLFALTTLIFGLTLFFFEGCKFFEENDEVIEILLPQWPPEHNSPAPSASPPPTYPPLSRWKITVSQNTGSSTFYTTEAAIYVKTTKNCPFSVTAQPVTLSQNKEEILYFYPAGFIYPFFCKDQKAKINNAPSEELKKSATPGSASLFTCTWEQGFLAHIMEQLYTSSNENLIEPSDSAYFISTFNWQKAQSLIEQKIAQDFEDSQKSTPFYNPWLCDIPKILKSLSQENFRASLLNNTSCVSFETQKVLENSKIQLLSPFILENSNIIQNQLITIKKGTETYLTDCIKTGIFINFQNAKNVRMEYIFIITYNG